MSQTQLETTEPDESLSNTGQTTLLKRPAAFVPTDKRGILRQLGGKVSARTVAIISGAALVVTVLALWGTGVFAAAPRVSVAVVGPAAISKQVAAQLDASKTVSLGAAVSHSEKAATRLVSSGTDSAILVVNPSGTADTLEVSSTASKAQVTKVQDVVRAAEASLHRTVTVTTIATPTAAH
jgi:hypothetical protein